MIPLEEGIRNWELGIRSLRLCAFATLREKLIKALITHTRHLQYPVELFWC